MRSNTMQKFSPFLGLLVLGIFLLLVVSVVRTSIFGEVESGKHIYFEIVFLLLLAVVGELAVVYTKQPSVMILMVLGIFMSESFISLAWETLHAIPLPLALPDKAPDILRLESVLNVFAQLGAVILLFKVGMHNRLERVFAIDNIMVAMAGVIFPFAAGYLYASLTGGSFAYSMFVAAALTATSVGVTVAVLREFKLLNERFAEIIIGAAIIDDILGLLVLSFVINTSSASGGEVFAQMAYTLATSAVFIFGSVAAGSHFIKYLDRKELSERRFLLMLAFVLFYAYFAEFIKLSAIVGAFMAGVMLNKSRHRTQIEEKTYGLEMLFLPIFFISLGMLIDVNSLSLFFIPILALSILAIFSKAIACGAAAIAAKLKPVEAAIVGIGMVPRGEVALIVASIGLSTKVLNSSEYSIIAAMALITTLAAPPILQMLAKRTRIDK